jgi:hypothetical protein
MSVVTNDRCLLTPEQIDGLAPDHATLRGARELAGGDQWGASGFSQADSHRLLWAEFSEGRRSPFQTAVMLPTMRVACNCAALRFPCRHVIALLLRDQAGQLPMGSPPAWADSLPRGRSGGERVVDPAADERRVAALVNGMAALRLWLADLAGDGLAILPQRNPNWARMAERLSGSYAVEIARELPELALMTKSGPDWPERLLPRLGRLALLAEAFRRLDELPLGERGDALAAAGLPPRAADDVVADEWLVAGRRQDVVNRQRRERVWLFGLTSRRWALLADATAGSRREGVCLPIGATAAGELAFAPSAWPLLARPAADLEIVHAPATGEAFPSRDLQPGLAGYAAALAANPWLRVYPLALAHVFLQPPATTADVWRVRDWGGRELPLPPKFAHGWRLLALSGGRPLSLFGEWDGAQFTPLSVNADGWQALAGWRGVP